MRRAADSLKRALSGPNRRRSLALLAVFLLAGAWAADALLLGRSARARWIGMLPAPLARSVARLFPGDAAAAYAAGRALRYAGDSSGAARLLRRAMELDPEFLHARGEYALALIDLGSDTQAYEISEGVLSREELVAPAAVASGRLHASRRAWRPAAVRAQAALQADPRCPDAWLLLARIALGRREWGEAARAADRAARLQPGWGAAWTLRAEALLRAGDAERALAPAEKAAALAPESAAAQRSLGLALLASRHPGSVERAGAALEKATRLDPDDGEARLALAEQRLAAGERAEAERRLKEVLRRWPELNRARLLLAGTARGNPEAARWKAEHRRWEALLRRRDELRAGIEESHYNPRIYVELARVYVEMGRLDTALQAVQTGLSRGPDPQAVSLERELRRRLSEGG